MATAAEISEYDTEELERQLGETRRELFNLRFQLATGQLDNFSRLNHVRKDVARMLTELRNREIAEAEGLALDQLPAHQAAARRRDEDEALGRDKSTASERRAAARAEAEERGRRRGARDEDVDDDDDDDATQRRTTDGRRAACRGHARSGPTPARSARAWWCPTPWTPPWSSPSIERVRHPRYGKTVQRTKKLYVHDQENTAKVGDRVRVVETRPLSKLKRWRLADVLERAR